MGDARGVGMRKNSIRFSFSPYPDSMHQRAGLLRKAGICLLPVTLEAMAAGEKLYMMDLWL